MPTAREIIFRLSLFAGMYALALLACLPYPPRIEWLGYLPYFVAFPTGLWTYFGLNADIAEALIGHVVYMGLVVWAVATPRRSASAAIYILICAVLALNVSGCRRVHREIKMEFDHGHRE